MMTAAQLLEQTNYNELDSLDLLDLILECEELSGKRLPDEMKGIVSEDVLKVFFADEA